MKYLLLVTWFVYACSAGADTHVPKTVSTTIALSVYLPPVPDIPGELESHGNCLPLRDIHADAARRYRHGVPATCLYRVEQTEHDNRLHLTVTII